MRRLLHVHLTTTESGTSLWSRPSPFGNPSSIYIFISDGELFIYIHRHLPLVRRHSQVCPLGLGPPINAYRRAPPSSPTPALMGLTHSLRNYNVKGTFIVHRFYSILIQPPTAPRRFAVGSKWNKIGGLRTYRQALRGAWRSDQNGIKSEDSERTF